MKSYYNLLDFVQLNFFRNQHLNEKFIPKPT